MKCLLIILATITGVIQLSAQRLPADPQATPETIDLIRRMEGLLEKGIMIGHQDSTVYGHGWKYDDVSDVKRVTGEFPAVFGWELGDLELGKDESLDKVSFAKIRESIKWAHANGGINTISWHGANAVTGENTWDNSSDQVVKSILPGGEKAAVYEEMLDRMAAFFLSLKTDDGAAIPVIFRPFHEHTGSWFWWGQNLCTKEEYVSLWSHTLNYLRAKGVHNLLVAYSAAGNFSNEAEYLERYPGDGFVDIIGFDTYQRGVAGKTRYVAGLKLGLDIVVPIGVAKDKIVILAETGVESVPDPKWWTETLWSTIEHYPISYVLFWRNAYDQPDHFYVPYPGQKSAEDFKEFEKAERTLFLKDTL